MQAITTKYLPATDTKGARIKARCESGSVTIPLPYELGLGQPRHRAAAMALARQRGWGNLQWLGATLPDNSGYVFVPVHAWGEE